MQTGLKINISQQTKEGKNALEKLKSFMFVVYNQDLLLPPFHSTGAPRRECLVATGLHRETQARVSGCRGRAHLTASGGLRGLGAVALPASSRQSKVGASQLMC